MKMIKNSRGFNLVELLIGMSIGYADNTAFVMTLEDFQALSSKETSKLNKQFGLIFFN